MKVKAGRLLLFLFVALFSQACGVKGAPRPPIDTKMVKTAPDAGMTLDRPDGGGQCSKDR
jgi:hypothetical protein